MDAENRKKLNELIEDIDDAMLVSKTPEGELRSRPMGTQQMDESGALWFFSDRESAKIHELEEFSQVNLAYSHPGKRIYVSISGRAQIVEDRSKIDELWKPSLKVWFPNGKEDSSICLIKVQIAKAEYWDTRSSAFVLLFEAAKALLYHEPVKPSVGHAKIA